MSCRDIIFFPSPSSGAFLSQSLAVISFMLLCLLFSAFCFVFVFFALYLFIFLFFSPLLLLLLCFSHCRVVLIPSLCWGMFHKIYICRYARRPWTFLLQDNLHIFLVKIPPKDAELSYECRPHIPSTAAPSFVSCLEINVNFFLQLDCLNRGACDPSCQ